MNRLLAAQRELRAFRTDKLFNQANDQYDVSGLAKIREALCLIAEANLCFGKSSVSNDTIIGGVDYYDIVGDRFRVS
jgi:hypothetical protein